MRRSALGILLTVASLLKGAGTATWELTSYQDFVKGRFESVSLSRDGRLTIAPKLETLFTADQPALWSIVEAPDHSLYLASGHRGRVFHVDPAGKSTLAWTSPEPEVFALALDGKGTLFAGTSPDGKVYRIEKGKAEEYFDPKAKYVWALTLGKDGSLFVATGDQGKVFRVTARGQGELYYDTGQTHVTSLAVDAQGRLLAGSEPNGILYRIAAKDKAFVLYDSNLPEIRAILPQTDGSIYAAALGGSLSKRTAAATGAATTTGSGVVSATSTSITVTDDAAAQAGPEIKPKGDAPKAQPAATAAPAASPILDLTGVEKAAVYKIYPDNTIETLWSSKEENVFDIVRMGTQIYFSTDVEGRIYRLNPDRKVTLLTETREGETTRLLESGGRILATTSNMGKLFRLGLESGIRGGYTSPVHDAGTVARWGRLGWRGELPSGTKLLFRTRSGNSARPDKTWSEWSEPIGDPAGSPVTSPNARFLQWQAEFTGSAGKSPALENVSVAYLPQNAAPLVKSITVTPQVASSTAAKPAAQQSATAVYSITVTDTGEASSTSSGTPTQLVGRTAGSNLLVSWQAEDPDADKLLYTLSFRGEGEKSWKVIRNNLFETSLTLDGDVLADGKYFFRVQASDSPANPPGLAREAELVSAPILIDNTPPVVTAGAARRSGAFIEIMVEAVDASSQIRKAEYSVDAGPWTPLAPEDGVADSPRERFPLRLQLPEGEHLIVVRAYDAANNAGLAKVVVQ